FMCTCLISLLFFRTAPATTAIYTLSLHDALPISWSDPCAGARDGARAADLAAVGWLSGPTACRCRGVGRCGSGLLADGRAIGGSPAGSGDQSLICAACGAGRDGGGRYSRAGLTRAAEGVGV